MFNLHPHNIKQVAAVVNKFGVCYVHGDGNMFKNEEASLFRREFCNPDAEDSKNWVKLEKGGLIPTSVDQLEKMIQVNMQKEKKKKKAENTNKTKIDTINVDDDEDNEYQAPLVDVDTLQDGRLSNKPVFADMKTDTSGLKDVRAQFTETQKALNQREIDLDTASEKLEEEKTKASKAIEEKAGFLSQKEKELHDREAKLEAMAADLEKKTAALAKKEPKDKS